MYILVVAFQQANMPHPVEAKVPYGLSAAAKSDQVPILIKVEYADWLDMSAGAFLAVMREVLQVQHQFISNCC